jgi:hypothetical protein
VREAIKNYWFDVNNDIFPVDFQHTTLGIVWGNGGAYSTWWTPNPEEIHGINWLPITAGSLYLGQWPEYLQENYNELLRENGAPPQEWRDIAWEMRALYAPDSASAWLQGNPVYTAEDGESKAHTIHWIQSLTKLGTVDTTVTADCPSYAVFKNNNMRSYVIFNDKFESKKFTFSDGKQIFVGARTYGFETVTTGNKTVNHRSVIQKESTRSILIVNGDNGQSIALDKFSDGIIFTLDGKRITTKMTKKVLSGNVLVPSHLFVLKR